MHPKGSGFYVVAVSLLFIGGTLASFSDLVSTDKELFLWLIRTWLVFVSCTLFYWGSNRIRTGGPGMTVGQETINMVNGIFTSTIALLALMFGK